MDAISKWIDGLPGWLRWTALTLFVVMSVAVIAKVEGDAANGKTILMVSRPDRESAPALSYREIVDGANERFKGPNGRYREWLESWEGHPMQWEGEVVGADGGVLSVEVGGSNANGWVYVDAGREITRELSKGDRVVFRGEIGSVTELAGSVLQIEIDPKWVKRPWAGEETREGPIIQATFKQIADEAYSRQKRDTNAKYEAWLDSWVGKRVKWSGVVDDVYTGGEIALEVEGAPFFASLRVFTDESTALQFSKGDSVEVVGKISRAGSNLAKSIRVNVTADWVNRIR